MISPAKPYDKSQLASLRANYREVSLIGVLREHNLTLPRNAYEWRVPPEPEAGYIRGITQTSVRLLCTDGVLGWFAWDNGEVILGHMQHWEPLREPKTRAGGPKATKLQKLVDQIGD